MSNVNKHSIIDFPDDYIVIDFETTGLSRQWDEIIEMGALKVIGGDVVDTFSTFVKPSLPLDPFITELTGITNEMLADAPSIENVMPLFLDFIRNSIIVGHNVTFDLSFLRNNTDKELNIDYIDTLRLSRKLYNGMEHHRLSDMAEYLGFPREQMHRSIDDCNTTLNLFIVCHEEAIKQYGDVDAFKAAFKPKNYGKSGSRIDISSLIADPDSVDEDSVFYEKECVFTGALEKMKRADAMQLVINIGGRVGNNVTKKTNYLILGNNDYCKAIKDGKSSKHKKAEQLKLKGQDIEIMPEQTFYEMIGLQSE